MWLEIPDAQRGLMTIITEVMQPPVENGTRLPLIFDLDVVRQSVYEPHSDSIHLDWCCYGPENPTSCDFLADYLSGDGCYGCVVVAEQP
jgi:hypothetical protein